MLLIFRQVLGVPVLECLGGGDLAARHGRGAAGTAPALHVQHGERPRRNLPDALRLRQEPQAGQSLLTS